MPNISQIFYSKSAFELDPIPTYGLNVSDIFEKFKIFEKNAQNHQIKKTLRVHKNLTKHFVQKPSSGLSISYKGLSKKNFTSRFALRAPYYKLCNSYLP